LIADDHAAADEGRRESIRDVRSTDDDLTAFRGHVIVTETERRFAGFDEEDFRVRVPVHLRPASGWGVNEDH